MQNKEYYLIGTGEMPAMAVLRANNETIEKLLCKAVRENLDCEKVEIVKISDFNHKTFQHEAKVNITLNDETEEDIVYITPISLYK